MDKSSTRSWKLEAAKVSLTQLEESPGQSCQPRIFTSQKRTNTVESRNGWKTYWKRTWTRRNCWLSLRIWQGLCHSTYTSRRPLVVDKKPCSLSWSAWLCTSQSVATFKGWTFWRLCWWAIPLLRIVLWLWWLLCRTMASKSAFCQSFRASKSTTTSSWL